MKTFWKMFAFALLCYSLGAGIAITARSSLGDAASDAVVGVGVSYFGQL